MFKAPLHGVDTVPMIEATLEVAGKPMDKNQLLYEEFLNYLSVEKGLAQNTLDAYRRDLSHYDAFLKKEKVSDWSKVSRTHIMKYLNAESTRGLESSSIARGLVSVKLFHRFLTKERYVPGDITSVLESPKLWKKLPQFLTSSEMESLLKMPDNKKPGGLRDLALLECLYATGIGSPRSPRSRWSTSISIISSSSVAGKGTRSDLCRSAVSRLPLVRRI